MRQRQDAVELQGVVEVRFADRPVGGLRGELDVGDNAAVLRAVAARTVELLDRHLQGAVVRRIELVDVAAEFFEFLDRALAVSGLVADDDAAAVVLDGAGEDFACAGAELVDYDHQRAFPDRSWFVVGIGAHLAIWALHLDDRALIDEQTGHFDRLGERTAAVKAEVHHHHVDVLLLQLFEELANVANGALVVGLAAASAFHVHVEAGQIDHADLVRLGPGASQDVVAPPVGKGQVGPGKSSPAVPLDDFAGRFLSSRTVVGNLEGGRFGVADDLALRVAFEHGAAGFAVLQLDAGAGDVVIDKFSAAGLLHFQANDAPWFAADLHHDVIELHVGDVDHLAVRALGDAGDDVVDLEAAVLIGGAAGDDVTDDGFAVLRFERGADAVELQPHLNREVLEILRRHVAAVGIEAHRHRGEEHFEQFVVARLVPAAGDALVALVETLERLVGRGFVVGRLEKEVVLHALAPAFVGLFLGLEPSHLLGVAFHRFVDGEVVRLVDQLLGDGGPFGDALEEEIEDPLGEGDVARLNRVVDLGAFRSEPVDVALIEVELHRIERLEVHLQGALGDVVVDPKLGHVALVDQRTDEDRDVFLRDLLFA